MKVTLKQVGAAAGVSSATASLVLNQGAPRKRVRPEIAGRVRAEAERLGYRRDAMAGAMRTGRSQTLAFALDQGSQDADTAPAFSHGYWTTLLSGLELELRRQGWHLLLIGGSTEGSALGRALDAVRDRRCDGVVVAGRLAWRLNDELPDTGDLPPLVAIDPPASVPEGICRIDCGIGDGFAQATRLLVERGHRHLAFIPSISPAYADTVKDRIAHIRAALPKGGRLSVIRRNRKDRSAFSSMGSVEEAVIDTIQRQLAELLRRGRPAWTALLAFNDLMALGAMAALQQAGLRIPEDVAVVGCDDDGAVYAHPGLTSIDPGHLEAGRRAARVIIDAIERPDEPWPARILLPARLVERASTACTGART